MADTENLRCPRCGAWAQRLPEGQDKPTLEQSYESCWLRHDGSQPDEPSYRPGVLCSHERSLAAGLIHRLQNAIGDDTDKLTPAAVAAASPDTRALLLIRIARHHPLAGNDLVLLLVERLVDLTLYSNPRPGAQDNRPATLGLSLRGTGGAQALATRHKDELEALIGGLVEGRGEIWQCFWKQDSSAWNFQDAFPVNLVEVNEVSSFRYLALPLPRPGLQPQGGHEA